ncbi:BETA-13-N-ACETYLGLUCOSAMINYLTRANSFERASE [Salix viminalis]|uniref:BETA-13-N-ACETYLGLUCOSAMINYLTRANSFERASE n=1 Tax=Salix viminalis TaxID=40686 RepID=A0A9Q0U027_SALVM|nr:BETA-13-N-ACETYLGLUCOSAMINYLTRANSFERASE [Salix viminalis]
MKKWSGGVVIIALAIILIFSYNLMGTQSQKKQSSYDFFQNHPAGDSHLKEDHPAKSPQLELKKATKSSKKPHYVNVEGLSDLYAPNNISKDESKVLLVWFQMRLLLSRSDALPETNQGIREASIAWKDLLSKIKVNKAAQLSNTDKSEDKNCPYSVSTVDLTTSIGEKVLDIPCGLAEDSSISVLGIPDGHSKSFQIELLGSQFPNTWTTEHGWGKEERCPSHRSVNIPKVDGLVLCNEKVVRSTMEENGNASSVGNVSVNVSQEIAHERANFPFVEGNAFTATLWVGLEGFHMTVNGRHETSFVYREKLEPWLVSGVKVTGGVDILSALARGLPVSENNDLVVDVEHLKAPLVTRKRLVMLIGIFSTGNNFERRMALRRSWMQYEAARSGDVAVRFFIGLHKNSQVNLELWKEALVYGDIQLMPFVDYYSLISLKTIAICIMGTKILPAKYIMKTDDDAFVRIDQVLTSLKEKPTNGLLYGRISFDSSPHRDRDSKWYISNEEWPHDAYPPWAHGPGYIISRDIAKFIVRGHQERDLKLFKLEDVAMGIWIEQFKNSGQEVHYMTDERFYNAGCETDYILAHYQSPRLVLCLWEKLQKEHQPACCE